MQCEPCWHYMSPRKLKWKAGRFCVSVPELEQVIPVKSPTATWCTAQVLLLLTALALPAFCLLPSYAAAQS